MNPNAPAKPNQQPPSADAVHPDSVQLREVRGIALHHTLEEDYSVYEPASFVERGFATLIDSFIVGIVMSLMNLPFLKIIDRFTDLEQSENITAIKLFITVLAFAVFQIAPLVLWGQTLGKSFFGIILLTNGDSTNVGFSRVLARETLGKAVSLALLGVGLALMLVRKDKLTLHDLMCKTKVVKHRRL